jgi:hypothetical protein
LSREMVGLAVCIVCLWVAVLISAFSISNMKHEIRKLNHACIPTDTGGGVTQCLQPSVIDTALRACYRNDSYIGKTQEDTRHLFVQCMSDYLDMRGLNP